MHEAGDVFGVDDADDVLGAAGGIVDGDAGVLLVDDAGAGVLDEHVGGEREDSLARGHDFAGGDFVEFEGAVDERLLKLGEHAHAAGGGGDELEFFGRVDCARSGRWARRRRAGRAAAELFSRRTAGRAMDMKTCMGRRRRWRFARRGAGRGTWGRVRRAGRGSR